MDGQGITHFAYSWADTFFDVMCEVYTIGGSRMDDEPQGATPTCVWCWRMVLVKGAKAKGQM